MSIITRIDNTAGETSLYPFVSNYGIPKNLITGISILCPQDKEVYVYNVKTTDKRISVTFVLKEYDMYNPFAEAGGAVSGFGIVPIISIKGERIGWITCGTISEDIDITGVMAIAQSCISRDFKRDKGIIVNGTSYDTPSRLAIQVAGDLSYDHLNHSIYSTTTDTGSLLNSYPVPVYGGVYRINNLDPDDDHGITIKIPSGYSIEKSSLGSVIVLTIKNMDQGDNSPFSCPDTNTLRDTIYVDNNELKGSENPLDYYINKYRDYIKNQHKG